MRGKQTINKQAQSIHVQLKTNRLEWMTFSQNVIHERIKYSRMNTLLKNGGRTLSLSYCVHCACAYYVIWKRVCVWVKNVTKAWNSIGKISKFERTAGK